MKSEYKEKFRTPEEAVKCVKSGDWVDYMYFNGYPKALDRALAKKRDELYGCSHPKRHPLPPFPEVPISDPTMEHFQWDSWHFSAWDAKLSDQGICSFSPLLYHEVPVIADGRLRLMSP